jgi:hypothetical protein
MEKCPSLLRINIEWEYPHPFHFNSASRNVPIGTWNSSIIGTGGGEGEYMDIFREFAARRNDCKSSEKNHLLIRKK